MGLITWVAIGVIVLVGIGLGWGVFFSGLTQGVEKVAENPAVQQATDEAAEFIDESIDTETSSIDRLVVVNTEKTVYTQQEPVVIIVKNEGNQTMQVSDSSIEVQIRNADDNSQENDVVVVSQVITELDPGESVTISWDQRDSNGNHVKSGKYVAIVNNVPSEEESSRTTTFTIEA